MRTLIGCFQISLIALFAPIAVADDLAWRVENMSGDVSVSAGGLVPAAVDPRRDLPKGAVVVTGANGRAVLRRGAEQIIVAPDSRVTLSQDGRVGTRVDQSLGIVLFSVGKGAKPHFQVDTPYLAAVVKGTVFTVTVGALGAEVRVSEGAVEVATAWRDAVALVKAGGSARVLRSAPDQIDLLQGKAKRVVTGYDAPVSAGGGGFRAQSREPGAMFAAAAAHRETSLAESRQSTGAEAPVGATDVPVSSHHSANSGREISAGIAGSGGDEVAGVASIDRGSPDANAPAKPEVFSNAQPSSVAPSGGHRLPPDFKRAKFSDLDGGLPNGTLEAPDAAANDFVVQQAQKVVSVSRRITAKASRKLRSEFPWTEVLLAGLCLVGYIFGSHLLGQRRRARSGDIR